MANVFIGGIGSARRRDNAPRKKPQYIKERYSMVVELLGPDPDEHPRDIIALVERYGVAKAKRYYQRNRMPFEAEAVEILYDRNLKL